MPEAVPGAAENVEEVAPPLFPPARPAPVHSPVDLQAFFTIHGMGAIFPICAGIVLYGWRAAGVIAAVVGAAAVAQVIWRRIGWRGWQLRMSHALWLALLLSLILPARLFSISPLQNPPVGPPWPVLPAAGITLVIFVWLLGGPGSGRVHPVLVAYLLLFVLFAPLLIQYQILTPDHLLIGDITKSAFPEAENSSENQPWIALQTTAKTASAEPASERLIKFTTGKESPERASVSLQMLIRDRMPPLENLIVAGNPGGIGTSSAIAVIIGGLFLLYRGLIDYRIPLLAVIFALIGLLVLPVPVLITDNAVEWHWLAFREHFLGWPTAVTFANYEIMASPLLFTLFFLATAPGVRPMTRRGRTVYAALIGLLAATFQLYMSVSAGPFLALLAASMLTPVLDKLFRPRPLI